MQIAYFYQYKYWYFHLHLQWEEPGLDYFYIQQSNLMINW